MAANQLQRRAAEAGFSVVEGLIAALLLLIVVLGVLPLVSRSMMNNVQGNDATTQANAAMSGNERLLSLPFDNIDMSVPAGALSVLHQEVWTQGVLDWIPLADLTAGDPVVLSRDTLIEQFSASDFDTDGTFDTPLDGVTDPVFVHLKRITTTIRGRAMVSFTPYRLVAVQGY